MHDEALTAHDVIVVLSVLGRDLSGRGATLPPLGKMVPFESMTPDGVSPPLL